MIMCQVWVAVAILRKVRIFCWSKNSSPNLNGTKMPALSLEDGAMSALVGAFIGDTSALGPQWYYDLDQLHADYGEWISDYATPKPGRYHTGKCGRQQENKAPRHQGENITLSFPEN